ncbi:hypothetical protein FACS189443_6930 [Planctomycetales bacterium]|nr:hypothetical protein FACS189443_6930 [Planctomycetales bacterium]
MPTLQEERQAREVLSQKLASGDAGLQKEAAATLDKFIRKTFKEQSFFDQIIEPQQLTKDDFYQHMTSDKLYVRLEIEPECPAAITMSYNTPAPIMTMGAKRTLCSIDRIKSVRMKREVNEMLTLSFSLRDIYCDFQLKEVLTKYDIRGIQCTNSCVGPAPNTVMASTGSVHYRRVSSGLTPNTFAESLKYIPKLGRDNSLNVKTMLMNTVTFKEFAKWGFLDVGNAFHDVLENGLSSFENGKFGVKFITTIKRYLVPDGTVYQFADPTFIGRNYVWIEPTMIIKQRDHSVEFSVFTERGGGVFVFLGIVRADYTGV